MSKVNKDTKFSIFTECCHIIGFTVAVYLFLSFSAEISIAALIKDLYFNRLSMASALPQNPYYPKTQNSSENVK